MSFEELRKNLDNPREFSKDEFAQIWWWMRPKWSEEGRDICQIIVDAKIFNTVSDSRRKIKENCVSWNGVKVTDPSFKPTFIEPGFGIIKIGKKNHYMVMG
jgi:tyrosyl-tRNA synthetase